MLVERSSHANRGRKSEHIHAEFEEDEDTCEAPVRSTLSRRLGGKSLPDRIIRAPITILAIRLLTASVHAVPQAQPPCAHTRASKSWHCDSQNIAEVHLEGCSGAKRPEVTEVARKAIAGEMERKPAPSWSAVR